MGWLTAVLAGALTGVLSGFGVGGGTLLLIYLTAFAGMPQNQAQGINLLYFLPSAAAALPAHIKHGYVENPSCYPPSSPALCAPPWLPGPPPGWIPPFCTGALGASCWQWACGSCFGKSESAILWPV